LIEVIRLDWR